MLGSIPSTIARLLYSVGVRPKKTAAGSTKRKKEKKRSKAGTVSAPGASISIQGTANNPQGSQLCRS